MALLTRHQAFSESQLIDFVRHRFREIPSDQVPMFVAGAVAGAMHAATRHFVALTNSQSVDPSQRGQATNASSDLVYWISGFAPEPDEEPDTPSVANLGPLNAGPSLPRQRPEPEPSERGFDVDRRILPVSFDASASDYNAVATAARYAQIDGSSIVPDSVTRMSSASAGIQYGPGSAPYHPLLPHTMTTMPPEYLPTSEVVLKTLASQRRDVSQVFLHIADTSLKYVQSCQSPLSSALTSGLGLPSGRPLPPPDAIDRPVTPIAVVVSAPSASDSVDVSSSLYLASGHQHASDTDRTSPHLGPAGPPTGVVDMPSFQSMGPVSGAAAAPSSSPPAAPVASGMVVLPVVSTSTADGGFVCTRGLTPPPLLRDDSGRAPGDSMPPPKLTGQPKKPKLPLSSTTTSGTAVDVEGEPVFQLTAAADDVASLQDEFRGSRVGGRDERGHHRPESSGKSDRGRRRDSEDHRDVRRRRADTQDLRREDVYSGRTTPAGGAYKCGPLERPSDPPHPLRPLPFLEGPSSRRRQRRGSPAASRSRSARRLASSPEPVTQSYMLSPEEVETIRRYREDLKRVAPGPDRVSKRPERRRSPRLM